MNATENHHGGGELVCRLAEGSRLKLVGLGGVGCIVLQFLAIFLHSLALPLRLVLIDGDKFEIGNMRRMAFHTLGNKAEVKAAETLEMLGDSSLHVVAVPEYLHADNVARLILPGDYVLLCVDNHPTRRLVSEHCQTLADVALFNGGNDGVEPPERLGTYGNVQVELRRDGRELTFPITRLHPEIAQAEGHIADGPDCGQLAVSTPQILFANLAVASAMLSAFFVYVCGRLGYQEVQFDILQARCVPHFPLPPERIPLPP